MILYRFTVALVFVWLVLLYAPVSSEESKIETLDSLSTPSQALRKSDIPEQHITLQPPRAVLNEVRALLKVEDAWKIYDVDGEGMTAAILDTGIAQNHPDFDYGGRVIIGKNFTSTGGQENTSDDSGHGTHVAGIIAARRQPGMRGIAPYANVVPLKVISGVNNLSYDSDVLNALNWVLDYNKKHLDSPISVVNMSFELLNNNFCWNPVGDCIMPDQKTLKLFQSVIQQLRNSDVAVVAAAGNGYGITSNITERCFTQHGMAFPAIIPEVISVASVYDADLPGYQYDCGAEATKRMMKFPTPYSRRLSDSQGRGTDFFAPGSVVKSSGLDKSNGYSQSLDGSSQAAPAVSGVILLIQQYWKKKTGKLPKIDQVETWLHHGAMKIIDVQSSPSLDNVIHTGADFHLVNALNALNQASSDLPSKSMH